LIVQGLTKTCASGVRALDGVQLRVCRGLYGLLGPNGAGKSTLMRTLATLRAPDAGAISFRGRDVLADPDALRRRLGYLPQQISAYPGVIGRSLLERFAWLKGRTDRKQRAAEVATFLERVNLSEASEREVATYSGGMLRRFGIALARLLGASSTFALWLVPVLPALGLVPAEAAGPTPYAALASEYALFVIPTALWLGALYLCAALRTRSSAGPFAVAAIVILICFMGTWWLEARVQRDRCRASLSRPRAAGAAGARTGYTRTRRALHGARRLPIVRAFAARQRLTAMCQGCSALNVRIGELAQWGRHLVLEA
jgi:ABC-type transport system involved in cytochrome c biogenesis ATPase subunit